jgi:preprotein translocase subunit SecY
LPPWWSTGSALTIPGIRGQPLYLLIYVVLIAFFVFFYTPVVFIPQQAADNLRQHGGLIPVIHPGTRTAEYIDYVLTRIIVIGAST